MALRDIIKKEGEFIEQPTPPEQPEIPEKRIEGFMAAAEESDSGQEAAEALSSTELESLWSNADEPTYALLTAPDREKYDGEVRQIEDGEWWQNEVREASDTFKERAENQKSLNADPVEKEVVPTAFGDLVRVKQGG